MRYRTMIKMIKKGVAGILILIFVSTIWYLFIKTNDFEVVIHVKGTPGTVYQNVLAWNKELNKEKTTTVFVEKKPFKKLIYTCHFESYQLVFDWEIDKISDSLTKVSVGINDLDRSFMTRVQKLFGSSPIETLIHQEFTGFNEELSRHLDLFNVAINGNEKSPEAFVAYVNISCYQNEKANRMIHNSTYINTFLKDNDIALLSNPFVEILYWNKNTGQLNFNFCFPIAQTDSFPSHNEIQYKKVQAKKSLKATFQGNYSYIDNAWYTLHQYTVDNEIRPMKTITEVYHNNPHTDVKDANWTAAVYMEIE